MTKRQRAARRSILMGTAVISVLALTACGNGRGAATGGDVDFSAAPSGVLKPWGFENADDVGQARLDFAAQQLGDVDIQIDKTAFDAQKFTAATASGQVPDVVQMSARFVGTYAARGLIMPLDECLAENGVAGDHWYESVIGDVTYDSKIYGVPQFYQPPAIIVNSPLLEQAGVSIDAIDTSDRPTLLAAAKALSAQSGGNPSTLGLDPALPGNAGLWMLGAGGTIIDDQGRPTIDDAKNVETLEFLKELTDAQGGYAGIKSFIDTFDTFGAENQYVKNQVAAQINQQWYPNVLAENSPELDLRAVPFKDANGDDFSVASGSAFVIPVGSANPAAACSWMINLTSTDAWMAAGKARADNVAADPGRINTGLFTGVPEADEKIRAQYVVPTGSESFDQIISTYYDVVGNGRSYGSSAAGLEIQTELENAVVAALNGEKSPADALADGQAAAERAYDEATTQAQK